MIFDRPEPRVFALPPGADFPAALVAGLRARMDGAPPDAMADVTVLLNAQRMRQRVTDAFLARGPGVLPRLRLVTELGTETGVSALARRLDLATLIARLMEASPGLAPRSALFDLADSLTALIDEMREEGVGPEALAALDLSAHSAHWARTQAFLAIVARWFGPDAPADPAARAHAGVLALMARWQADPPAGPVILAGSTGSRGTTALLARAVARLPKDLGRADDGRGRRGSSAVPPGPASCGPWPDGDGCRQLVGGPSGP
jgi:ATP-dependent helicase/nuclease subunit B